MAPLGEPEKAAVLGFLRSKRGDRNLREPVVVALIEYFETAWELQRFTAGGVVRTIGTGVYHDELCKGVEVGVSRDAVLAAIL